MESAACGAAGRRGANALARCARNTSAASPRDAEALSNLSKEVVCEVRREENPFEAFFEGPRSLGVLDTVLNRPETWLNENNRIRWDISIRD